MELDLALTDKMVISTPLDEAIQELDMLFNTTNTELLGDTDYGTNFEQFLWDLTISDETIKKYINERIRMHTVYMQDMDYDIEIEEVPGEIRDIFYIKIQIKEGEKDPETGEYPAKNRRVYMIA